MRIESFPFLEVMLEFSAHVTIETQIPVGELSMFGMFQCAGGPRQNVSQWTRHRAVENFIAFGHGTEKWREAPPKRTHRDARCETYSGHLDGVGRRPEVYFRRNQEMFEFLVQKEGLL